MEPISCTLTVGANRRVVMEFDDCIYEAPICDTPLEQLIVARLDRLVTRHAELCEQADLRLLGQTLFNILFGGNASAVTISKVTGACFSEDQKRPLGDIFRAQIAANRVRLNLVFAPEMAEFARYPWEFLFILTDAENGFFAAGEESTLSITRIVPPPLKRAAPGSPLKVWIAWAAPNELGGLIVDATIATMNAKLAQRMRIEATELRDVTWQVLTDRLRVAGPNGPDILHFIGHGRLADDKSAIAFQRSNEDVELERIRLDKLDQDAGVKPNPNRVISRVDWRDVADLAAQLRGAPPWLLFLQTCEGAATSANMQVSRSAAQQIAGAGVSFVVAMQYKIANDDAQSFAVTFYDRLGNGDTIDQAVRAGRIELGKVTPVWGHRRFATPVVYLRSNDQVLVSSGVTAAPAPGEPTCPYKFDDCRHIDITSSECGCPRNKALVYCRKGHPNRDNVSNCTNRFCGEPLAAQPGFTATPLSALPERGAAAAPTAAPRDRNIGTA